MKSKASNRPGEGIRMAVLLPVGILLAVAIAVLVFSRQKTKPPVPPREKAFSSVNESSAEPVPTPPRVLIRPSEAPSQSVPVAALDATHLASLLMDSSSPQQARRQAARALAKIGTPEAMAALKAALAAKDTPPYVKVAIAEALGQSPSSDAQSLLHELLNGKDETVARGAARGLALRGDADAVSTLGTTLFSEQTPLSVRTEAALALGDVDLPGAQDLLTHAITQIQNEDIQESILDGLGRRPFSETEQFFRGYLDSPNVPADFKVLAIEAITDADGDVGPFLSNYLNASNPEVRAAAKSALDFLAPN